MFGIFFAVLCALGLWAIWRPRYYRGWGGGHGCCYGYGGGCGHWKGSHPGQPGASPDGPPPAGNAPVSA